MLKYGSKLREGLMEELVLKQHAKNIRNNIIDMVYSAQSGHPGGSLSAADILTYLYFEVMDINSENINTLNRDRFVLSKGHSSPALYAVLYEKDLLHEDLLSFRRLGSNLQGHPSMDRVAGVDMSTGSLGQGISVAVGMAIANKLDGNNHRIYTLIGDGEAEEGMVWEALMAAAHHNLDNLCVILDYNHLQIDGNIEDVAGMVNFKEKFLAFGAHVIDIDGHNFKDLEKAFNEAKEVKGKPTVIIANTHKGMGVSYMYDNADWHGKAPGEELYKQAKEDLK